MLEKATILDREDGVHQHFGNLTVTQYFPASRLRRNIVRQDLGFEPERFEQNTVATNFIDLVSRKRHAHDLFHSRRANLDRGTANAKTSTPNVAGVRFQVTGTSQDLNQFVLRQLLPSLEHERSCVKSGPTGQITTGESRIDDLGVETVGTRHRVSRDGTRDQQQNEPESNKAVFETDSSRIGQRFSLDNHPSVLPIVL